MDLTVLLRTAEAVVFAFAPATAPDSVGGRCPVPVMKTGFREGIRCLLVGRTLHPRLNNTGSLSGLCGATWILVPGRSVCRSLWLDRRTGEQSVRKTPRTERNQVKDHHHHARAAQPFSGSKPNHPGSAEIDIRAPHARMTTKEPDSPLHFDDLHSATAGD